MKDGEATHAWVLEGLSTEVWVEGAGPVDADRDQVDSLLGELIGALSFVYFVQALLDFFGEPEEAVDVNLFCDNKTVIGTVGNPAEGRGLKAYLTAEFEAREEINSMIKDLESRNVHVHSRWVKGHQDKQDSDEELTREALLNIDCDLCAGMFWEAPLFGLEPRECAPRYPSEKASLLIGGKRVTRRIQARTIEAHLAIAMLEYLEDWNDWNSNTLNLVDWTGMAPALGAESLDFRVQVIKFQHEWLNVGAQRVKIDAGASDACPCCHRPGERGHHLFTCEAENMRTSKLLALKEFEGFVKPVKTSPLILHTMNKVLRTLMGGDTAMRLVFPDTAVGRIL